VLNNGDNLLLSDPTRRTKAMRASPSVVAIAILAFRETQVALSPPIVNCTRRHRTTVPLVVLQWLFVLFVLIDAFGYFGVRFWPELTSRVGCSVRPFGLIATPLFPASWPTFVATACVENPTDPAISMIALMVKTSLAILGLMVALPSMAMLSVRAPALSSSSHEAYKAGDEFDQFETCIRAFVCFSALFGYCWYSTVSPAPQDLGTSFLAKLILENGFVFALWICGAMFVKAFAPIVGIPISRIWRLIGQK
jgi:hypothetical protein